MRKELHVEQVHMAMEPGVAIHDADGGPLGSPARAQDSKARRIVNRRAQRAMCSWLLPQRLYLRII